MRQSSSTSKETLRVPRLRKHALPSDCDGALSTNVAGKASAELLGRGSGLLAGGPVVRDEEAL